MHSIVLILIVAFRYAKVRWQATFAERKVTFIFRTMLRSIVFFGAPKLVSGFKFDPLFGGRDVARDDTNRRFH